MFEAASLLVNPFAPAFQWQINHTRYIGRVAVVRCDGGDNLGDGARTTEWNVIIRGGEW